METAERTFEKEDYILQVKDLHTSFFTDSGEVQAVNGVSFNLAKGTILGVVGESGSGKSVTAYSIMQILAETGRVVKGEILYKGRDLLKFSKKEMDAFRGDKCSIIFQDPMTSINPTFTIGWQIREALQLHTEYKTKKAAEARAIELLKMVGVNEPEARVHQYPFELSGGMRQRVMIAMALACEPDILIADEPTTALDVTIQAQILELMKDLQKKLGMAIILVTHDLGVIAQMCDEIIVMYGGRVCERGTADNIFYNPCHEYTKGLLRSIPKASNMKEKLVPIGGTPINMLALPKGCAFCPRCEGALKICLTEKPEEMVMNDGHIASCWLNVKKKIEEEVGFDDAGWDTWAEGGEAPSAEVLTKAEASIAHAEETAAARADASMEENNETIRAAEAAVAGDVQSAADARAAETAAVVEGTSDHTEGNA